MKINQYFLLISIILALGSCRTRKLAESQKFDGKELIKQFAYCKCLEYCLGNNNKKEKEDYSLPWLNGILRDYYASFFSHRINPTMDSIAKKEYEQIEKSKYPNEPVAEGTYGKASYALDCLNFYKSAKVDSTARALVKEFKRTYDVKKFGN